MNQTIARRAASALAVLALLLVSAMPVAAHATVPDGSDIPQGGDGAVIHVRIPHGCNGAQTDTVSVQLPDGVVNAKPEALAGWKVATERVTSAPYTLWGTTYTDRVGVVTWSGGSLPADQYLDFGISAIFTMEPGEYTVPVTQKCGADTVAWIEIPGAGQTEDDLEHPAPTITVVAAAGDGSMGGDTSGSGGASNGSSTSTDPLAYVAIVAALVALGVSVSSRRSNAAKR